MFLLSRDRGGLEYFVVQSFMLVYLLLWYKLCLGLQMSSAGAAPQFFGIPTQHPPPTRCTKFTENTLDRYLPFYQLMTIDHYSRAWISFELLMRCRSRTSRGTVPANWPASVKTTKSVWFVCLYWENLIHNAKYTSLKQAHKEARHPT
jgi:hypothetical protein